MTFALAGVLVGAGFVFGLLTTVGAYAAYGHMFVGRVGMAKLDEVAQALGCKPHEAMARAIDTIHTIVMAIQAAAIDNARRRETAVPPTTDTEPRKGRTNDSIH